MKRALIVVAMAGTLTLGPAIAADAHPLGNFTVNRYAGLRVQPDRVLVHYVVDMAEIPTFQERHAVDVDGDGRLSAQETGAYAARTCAQVARGAGLSVGGRPVALRPGAHAITFPPGAAGVPTMQVTCDISAGIRADRGDLVFRDSNFADRIGWREITAIGDGTTLEASDVPRASTSHELTRYPDELLASPLDVKTATIRFRPGGALAGPRRSTDAGPEAALLPRGLDGATRAFTSFLERRSLTIPLGAAALLLALALGAVHALAPGHGKTVMAAFLVGQRGSLRQGALIGLTVTATHTAGVLVLGLLISLSTTFAPERLYPLLGVASGILLCGIGASLLRRALRSRRDRAAHVHAHERALDGRELSTGRLVGLGFAGGLVPSPSALVVLLGAMTLGRAWFGVALVVAYGLGMASTLTAAGLLLVKARSFFERRHGPSRPRLAFLSRAIPLVTAATITVVGLTVAARGALQI